MNLPKKLEKLRDEKLFKTDGSHDRIYCEAFNYACEILLPEIEKMREALKDISANRCYDCSCDDTAIDALKQWQEFVEGE